MHQAWLCTQVCWVKSLYMCVVSLVKWSDGGGVWGVPTASFRFGPKGDVPSPASGRHTESLCRCVEIPSCGGLWLFPCGPYSPSFSHSGTALLDWIFYEWIGLPEQWCWSVSGPQRECEHLCPCVVYCLTKKCLHSQISFYTHTECFSVLEKTGSYTCTLGPPKALQVAV